MDDILEIGSAVLAGVEIYKARARLKKATAELTAKLERGEITQAQFDVRSSQLHPHYTFHVTDTTAAVTRLQKRTFLQRTTL
jgi:hypothetical protein